MEINECVHCRGRGCELCGGDHWNHPSPAYQTTIAPKVHENTKEVTSRHGRDLHIVQKFGVIEIIENNTCVNIRYDEVNEVINALEEFLYVHRKQQRDVAK